MDPLSHVALLLLLSSGWNSLLFLSLILACPLGMWIMMRSMNRRGGSQNASDESEPRRHDQTSDDETRKR